MEEPSGSVTVFEKVAEVVLAYYRQADTFAATAQEQQAWYHRQGPEARQELTLLKPALWMLLPGFRRHALESTRLLHAALHGRAPCPG